MFLWTIQTIEAWDILQKSGKLRCNSKFSEQEFIAAYSWMAERWTIGSKNVDRWAKNLMNYEGTVCIHYMNINVTVQACPVGSLRPCRDERRTMSPDRIVINSAKSREQIVVGMNHWNVEWWWLNDERFELWTLNVDCWMMKFKWCFVFKFIWQCSVAHLRQRRMINSQCSPF